jgi:hypothetical protein
MALGSTLNREVCDTCLGGLEEHRVRSTGLYDDVGPFSNALNQNRPVDNKSLLVFSRIDQNVRARSGGLDGLGY